VRLFRRIALRGSSANARGVLLWAAALATGMICVWEHVYAGRLASGIESLEDRRERLEAEIGFLRMECARLSGRERIEAYAIEHLGMRYPTGDEVVRLGPDRATPRQAPEDHAEGGAGAPDNG